ncbi:outer membrane protein [Celeribacter sp. SCSIO 80788]|jgi:opacity protein-like surface antigen|uniref:outer membrane protein n=1 Tax=Celeribacter sp. SCSIO 80788 TaxID=3117013 RepID=UPI003DA615FD
MKNILKIAAVFSLSAGTALAGGYSEPVAEPVIPVAPMVDADWGGFYAGLGYAGFFGEADYGSDYEFKDTANPMLFAGYRLDKGKLVYGLELAASFGDVWEDGYTDSYGVTALYDLKASLGYDMGKFLPYISLGYSFGDYMFSGNDGYDMDGYLVGLGFDYAINDKFTAGLSYDYRDMDVDGVDVNLQSVALKLAYTF